MQITKTHVAVSGKTEGKGHAIPGVFDQPVDPEIALASDEPANQKWADFAPSHRKLYLFWVLDAKRQETRQMRITKTMEFVRGNKKTVV